VHHGHHPGLLQEAEQPHGQEDPAAGVGYQLSTEICEKMCKNMLSSQRNKMLNRRIFYGGISCH
jgi:hypothetical protein